MSMFPSAPKRKRLPVRGDRVKRRGYSSTGVVKTINDDDKWACVTWDGDGPKYVHLYELDVLSSNGE